MSNDLLSKEDCARCQQCCIFDSYSLRNTPVITEGLAVLVKSLRRDVRFVDVDGVKLFMMEREGKQDIYKCPMLDPYSGCMLGEAKPFECRIFPFTLMRMGGHLVIAVSAYCPVIVQKSLADLRAAASEIAPIIFAAGADRPELIRPYENGYIVLVTDH